MLKIKAPGKITVCPPQDPAGKWRRRLTALPFYPLLCRFYLWHWFKAAMLEPPLRRHRPPPKTALPAAKPSSLSLGDQSKITRLTALFRTWQQEAAPARFLVLLFPGKNQVFTPSTPLIALEQALKQAYVPVVNTSPWFRTAAQTPDNLSRFYYQQDGHWTSAGHLIVARGLTRLLTSSKKS